MEQYKTNALQWLSFTNIPESVAPYEFARKHLIDKAKDINRQTRQPLYYEGILSYPLAYQTGENREDFEEQIHAWFEEVFTVYMEREKVRAYQLRLTAIYDDPAELPEVLGGQSENLLFNDPEMSLIRKRIFLYNIK